MTSQFCRNFTQYRRSGKVTTEHPNLLYSLNESVQMFLR
nr:MAG TPA: hypothetical protein [Caudoviricetes sp.]